MALRSSLDLELRPLLKALRNRIEGLRGAVMEPKDRLEVFSRDGVPFMQLEIRRDHMNVDLWLPEDKLAEARATNLARPHPFDPDNAVVVRFERATDLTRVARWLEDAHAYALVRKESGDVEVAEKPTVTEVPATRKTATSTRTQKVSSGAAASAPNAPSSTSKPAPAKRSATARGA
ncbi:MAG: hypothetical protein AAFN74_02450 [Myxococcota bacterium]